MSMHAVRLECAGATVTVVSADQSFCRWVDRYFGTWWNAAEVDAASVCAGPLVTAIVDRDEYDAVALSVMRAPHMSTAYARAQMLLARDDSAGLIRAVSREEGLAYWSEPGAGTLDVIGTDTQSVATATARLAREVMRGVLLWDGWAVLHASAVVRDGRTLLTFGGKGAGKTRTAKALAARHQFELLANDRVFVRSNSDNSVDVLPWPSAVAVGLGLLEALGWFEIARERLQSGDALHPTQDLRVTDAILAGNRSPLWERGKELRPRCGRTSSPAGRGAPGHRRRSCSATVPTRRSRRRPGRRGRGPLPRQRRLHERGNRGPLPRRSRARGCRRGRQRSDARGRRCESLHRSATTPCPQGKNQMLCVCPSPLARP